MTVAVSPRLATPGARWLDAEQRERVRQWQRSWWWRWSLPTWGVIALIYGGWAVTVHYWRVLPAWFAWPLLIGLTAWHLSLQHELIHGHPTRWPWINHLLGIAPLAVFYPFAVYRDSHLQHHLDEMLTWPGADPESYYVAQSDWGRLPSWRRRLIAVRQTSLGRLLIGPACSVAAMLAAQPAWLARRGGAGVTAWALHVALLLLMLKQLSLQGLAPGVYLLGVAYPALSLTMVRSLLEHRHADAVPARSVLNEAAWPWRLLFLNLNYHLVHHDLPGVPWFGLARVYFDRRADYRRRNQDFCLTGYGDLLWRHVRRPVLDARHPEAEHAAAMIMCDFK
ncbi:MAG: fatty acid desaturase [Paludibacterium sp.]|uniref:fatty acid desaturase n=1 Tax=Paludibacterium sp. TaxID=1917523 RepID=UPI0025D30049|nr:fatty acid desaturase [Paludibacterium sp.]MBV8048440.1 fatty acid desaturase [Paludibacterium sp.]MBV8647143.1 fatty acid desaturase [Paludibacterium sp.]